MASSNSAPPPSPPNDNKTTGAKGKPPSRFFLLAGLSVVGLGLTRCWWWCSRWRWPTRTCPLDTLTDYRPKMPLRIFSADNVLIGEFGEERRNLVRFKDIPDVMKKAVLAIEDDRFYEHGGVDYTGILRAALHNATGGARQGASTITQQVARNFFLSSEQTMKRKAYEMLLAWKIEKNLSKDQILEVYMNQIYLGQRAFGFSSAAQIYFGKNLRDISVAEAAMLAGLPKAPSAYNPVVNPKRARTRQQYILQRMHAGLHHRRPVRDRPRPKQLKVKTDSSEFGVHAEYVAEMARQLVYEQFKEDTYTRGLNVFTTITKADQDAAYLALRRGVMDYERATPTAARKRTSTSRKARKKPTKPSRPSWPSIRTATTSSPPWCCRQRRSRSSPSPRPARKSRSPAPAWKSPRVAVRQGGAEPRIRRGAVIRVMQEGKDWSMTQMPEVESAFVAASTEDGAIRALVGGFDYNRNKFNHVTQAWRQPGSSFKPFIYSASLERGLSPATIINDAPISFDAGQTGGQAWEPKNYDGKYDGPMTMRKRPDQVEEHDLDPHPAQDRRQVRPGIHHPLRLRRRKEPALPDAGAGRGATTPLQMAGAYSVFANGGYRSALPDLEGDRQPTARCCRKRGRTRPASTPTA
jgi:penicillin-binding protein 1A